MVGTILDQAVIGIFGPGDLGEGRVGDADSLGLGVGDERGVETFDLLEVPRLNVGIHERNLAGELALQTAQVAVPSMTARSPGAFVDRNG